MNKLISTFFLLFVLTIMILSSCNQSTKSESDTSNAVNSDSLSQTTGNYSVVLPNKVFNGEEYFAKTEKMVKLTKDQLSTYQLDRIQRFKDRDLKTEQEISIMVTETLWENDKAKAVIIVENTGGESSGILVTYDNQGNYVSDKEIMYEDYVEYYTNVSSVVNNNVIEVKTVSNQYLDDGSEKSDSTIVKYTIEKSLEIKKQ